MRTFDRETWLRAQREWDDGDFSYVWAEPRRIATNRGFILPPRGTRHDDRDADPPSQRAIIYRALEDNRTRVLAIIRQSRSWGDVVDRIIGMEARLAEEADDEMRDDAWRRKDEQGPRESTLTIKHILDRIGDS